MNCHSPSTGLEEMPMTSAIDVRGVTKSFGGIPVLRDLDLSVQQGTVFALLGPNGAGKTTLINILSTLIAPDAGTVVVDGYDVVTEAHAVRRSIRMTGQAAAIDPMLTGSENLRMMGRLSGLDAREVRERTREIVDQFGLGEVADRRASTYSGGIRRRLDLALSLVVPPRLLFLDEPTTGLDTRSRLGLWERIRSLVVHGTTVFLTTQYLEEADQLADRVAVLDRGRIIAEGTASELKSRIGTITVGLSDQEGCGIRELATDGTLSGIRRAVDELDDAFAEGTVTIRRPSLDDVFLSLTGQADRAEGGLRS
jgi:ABC-2 type transport system ATP-binding protein